jgi:5-methyltetrahydrofolate--homocysteine methyltransferase
MEMVRAANVLNGTDENCSNWIMTYRDYQSGPHAGTAPATPAPAAGGRRGGRDARRAAAASTGKVTPETT